jgi:hypothetical protein
VGRAESASLAQQIPALIEANFNLAHPLVFLFAQPTSLRTLRELVFFVYQFFYMVQNGIILHD